MFRAGPQIAFFFKKMVSNSSHHPHEEYCWSSWHPWHLLGIFDRIPPSRRRSTSTRTISWTGHSPPSRSPQAATPWSAMTPFGHTFSQRSLSTGPPSSGSSPRPQSLIRQQARAVACTLCFRCKPHRIYGQSTISVADNCGQYLPSHPRPLSAA